MYKILITTTIRSSNGISVASIAVEFATKHEADIAIQAIKEGHGESDATVTAIPLYETVA